MCCMKDPYRQIFVYLGVRRGDGGGLRAKEVNKSLVVGGLMDLCNTVGCGRLFR